MFISKRVCDVISRWLRVNWDYILQNGNNYKNIYKPILSISYKDMIIEITSSYTHKDYCIGYRCECLLLTYTLSILHQHDKMLLDSITFHDTTEWIDLTNKLSSRIGTTYTICMCGRDISIMDGLCKLCYIFQYTRSEEEGGDCCICLSNKGAWVKLPCEHCIHSQCYYGMVVNKCPLCRADFNRCDIIINPYDV